MECKYCKKIFKTKSILNHHQKTAKYCLKIQQESGLKIKELFKCEYCNKSLSQKVDLERHLITCSVKKEKIITEKYKQQISIL